MTEFSSTESELIAEFCDDTLSALDGLADASRMATETKTFRESIDTIFRSVHTIKGNAGFFGLSSIKLFSHGLEDALDEIRSKGSAISQEIACLLTDAFQHLEELVYEVEQGQTQNGNVSYGSELIDRLRAACLVSAKPSSAESIKDLLLALAEEMHQTDSPDISSWADRVSNLANQTSSANESVEDCPIQPASKENFDALVERTFSLDGADVTSPIRNLVRDFQGSFEAPDQELKPAEHRIKATKLGASIQVGITEILDCDGVRLSSDETISFLAALELFQASLDRKNELSHEEFSETWGQMNDLFLSISKKAIQPAIRTTEKTESKKTRVRPRFLKIRQATVESVQRSSQQMNSLCIEFARLGIELVNKTQNEAVCGQVESLVKELASQSAELAKQIDDLGSVSGDQFFAKYERLASSLSEELGKLVQVTVDCQEARIERSLVDGLDSALVHLVRNVCDHAIESPSERASRGVPETGQLSLSLAINDACFEFVVEDDGRGIDVAKLRSKTVEKGLLEEEVANTLNEADSLDLIFLPGSSTAQSVSDISGRGVGLDAVRASIRELGGDIRVESRLGEGTKFTLVVPQHEKSSSDLSIA